jgi:acetylornithine deacetylase
MDSLAQLKSVVGDLDRDGFVSLLSKLISESARLQSSPERRGRGSARLQR